MCTERVSNLEVGTYILLTIVFYLTWNEHIETSWSPLAQQHTYAKQRTQPPLTNDKHACIGIAVRKAAATSAAVLTGIRDCDSGWGYP